MNPSAEARAELPRATVRRIRVESRQRDREFAPRSVDTGFALGVGLGLLAVALLGVLWLVTRHG